MAEPRRELRDDGRGQRGRYVASLLWPAGVPQAANDNHGAMSARWLLALTTAALIATALCATVC